MSRPSFRQGNHESDAVVATIGSVVDKERRERVPVIWVQHSDEGTKKGSDDWQIVSELSPDDTEPHVEKLYGDAFEDTDLEDVLSGLGVSRLVVVGAQTDACIRSTLHGAFVRGYDATLVGDAHTTEDQTPWGAPPPDRVAIHATRACTGSSSQRRDGPLGPSKPRTLISDRSPEYSFGRTDLLNATPR